MAAEAVTIAIDETRTYLGKELLAA